MGLEAALLTQIALGVSVGATVLGMSQNAKAAKAQKKAREEQQAQNKAQQMQERRQQIREERIKRARIMQSAENTGTAGSSGEIGAIGGMSTQLGSNLGANQSAIRAGEQISLFSQQAADASSNAQMFSLISQTAPTIASFGQSIFSNPSTQSATIFDASSEQKNLQR